MSKLSGAKNTIDVKVAIDELDVTSAETKAIYEEIKAYVLEHTGLQVSKMYIAQVFVKQMQKLQLHHDYEAAIAQLVCIPLEILEIYAGNGTIANRRKHDVER